MSEAYDPAVVALPHEHAALVRRVIRDSRGRPEPLLLLADYYTELSTHLATGGLVRAAGQAAACASRLGEAVRPDPPPLPLPLLSRLIAFIMRRPS